MDYANATSGISSQNNYNAATAGHQQAPAPRTISSAAGRLDSLNERLTKVIESLAQVSSQIGALSPAGASNGVKNSPPAAGAVGRLNEAADVAHMALVDIEALIAGIGRALG